MLHKSTATANASDFAEKTPLKTEMTQAKNHTLNAVRLSIAIFIMSTLAISPAQALYTFSITEIMYNPDGSDGGREWIEITLHEIYLNTTGHMSEHALNDTWTENTSSNASRDASTNTSSRMVFDPSLFTLFEQQTHHRLTLNSGNDSCSTILLATDREKIIEEYRLDNTLANSCIFKTSFSLNNNGEMLRLLYNNTVVDEVNYTNVAREGYALEREGEIQAESSARGGTPLDSTNALVENGMNEEISGQENTVRACNLTIELLGANDIYETGSTITYRPSISGQMPESYAIEYWIEDGFGAIERKKTVTENVNQKSFTPKITLPYSIFLIKALLLNVSCQETAAERLIVVRNSALSSEKNGATDSETSDMTFETKINVKSIKIIGQETREKMREGIVHLEIFKGETRKSVVSIKHIGLGKTLGEQKIHMLDKNTRIEAILSFPLACAYGERQTLQIEGLNESIDETVVLECPKTDDKTQDSENVSAKTVSESAAIAEKQTSPMGQGIESADSKNVALSIVYRPDDLENMSGNDPMHANLSNAIDSEADVLTGSLIYESGTAQQAQVVYAGMGLLGAGAIAFFLLKKAWRKAVVEEQHVKR